MNLYPVETGNFKLDGGAMFGVVPKTIWQRTNPADSNNLCNWAMRSLLIEDGERLILIDAGLGDKQSEKFFSYYQLNGDDTLEKSIRSHGFDLTDVTDVILTHLHFDHVGGAVKRRKDGLGYELTFPNATYWNHPLHWQSAINPNPREKASFLTENILPIQELGHLKFIETGKELGENISFLVVSGHTESQIIPHINYNGKTIVFCADLLPSVGHIPLPYVMGYDTQPLLTLQEKELFLNQAVEKEYLLFLQHDAYQQCCTVQKTERGVKLNEVFALKDRL